MSDSSPFTNNTLLGIPFTLTPRESKSFETEPENNSANDKGKLYDAFMTSFEPPTLQALKDVLSEPALHFLTTHKVHMCLPLHEKMCEDALRCPEWITLDSLYSRLLSLDAYLTKNPHLTDFTQSCPECPIENGGCPCTNTDYTKPIPVECDESLRGQFPPELHYTEEDTVAPSPCYRAVLAEAHLRVKLVLLVFFNSLLELERADGDKAMIMQEGFQLEAVYAMKKARAELLPHPLQWFNKQ